MLSQCFRYILRLPSVGACKDAVKPSVQEHKMERVACIKKLMEYSNLLVGTL